MENLIETEIKAWLKQEMNKENVPLYLKKVTCVKSCRMIHKAKIGDTVFSGIEAGKMYVFWICKLEESTLAVFIPGADCNFIVDADAFADWINAPDVNNVVCGKSAYVLISDWQGERRLVPEWSLYPEDIESRFPKDKKFAFWCPEFIINGEEWFAGVAFYEHLSAEAYPDKRFHWQAFYRIDTQKWLSSEECDYYSQKMKVMLSQFPVTTGKLKIQYFLPMIRFDFV